MKYKRDWKSPYFLIIFLIQMSCQESVKSTTSLDQQSFIPKPASINATGNTFTLKNVASIAVKGEKTEELERIAAFLSEELKTSVGFDLQVQDTDEAAISLEQISGSEYGEEGYELQITEEGIAIKSGSPEGVFRGVQTLLQLLPASGNSTQDGQDKVYLPTGTITDSPVYAYRGSMLDISRHFFGVEDIKRYIDLIVPYKMNHLHLHLTDDQGWRIEIKSWPNLTTQGGSTAVGGGPGGFLTQEDYKEIVAYAQDRYVTIVPEIDMPGHTNAALVSYPELNCDGKAPEPYTGTEVGFSTLCTGKEITYQFVDDVVRELAELTPGPYIHIGGDESHVTPLEDYIPFINRTQEIVQKHGKTMIGWDEVAHADLDSGTLVQLWAKPENAVKAVENGIKVILSPASRTYLDMQYDSTTTLGQNWAAYIEVDDAYQWEPASFIEGIGKEQIVGVEAPLWTETITTMDEIEYMVFPRVLGVAEIGWTPAESRDWEEYRQRLSDHGDRLKAKGVNFYESDRVTWKKGEVEPQ